MTIQSSVRTAGPYAGAGVIVAYPFYYKVFATTEVLVVKTEDATGEQTTLTIGSDYAVSLNPDQDTSPGGTVTLVVALASGFTLELSSDIAETQGASLSNQGGYFPKVIEAALDRAVILIQQLKSLIGRGLRVPELSGVSAFPAVADRKNKLASFDDNGDAAAVAPVEGTATALAILLDGPTGAAQVGVTPTGGVSSTDVQAALAELDTEWRAGGSATTASLAALDTRLDVLEALPLGGAIVAKDTQANLYADLAYGAGTLGYVTNDGTSANNGYYRKLGGSGSGSWVQSSSAADTVTNAAGQLALRIHQALPVYGDDMIALKVANDRWLIRVPVVGGQPHDYTEFEMFNWGPGMGITHAWALHSVRARIAGVGASFMEQHPTSSLVSTNEFATKIIKDSDYTADPARWNNLTYADYYGFGHGHMDYLGLGIYLDGGATNYRDISPVGTELRGTKLQFSQNFAPKTPDGTVIGSHSIVHNFTAAGLQVAHQATITLAGILAQNSYAAMVAFTGVDRIKAIGQTAVTVGLQTGAQTNLGEYATFAGYYNDRPTALMELILPYGGPISGGSWAECTTTDTFILDNANRIRKLYVNWRSGTVPTTYFGVYSFDATYRVRSGATV